MKITRVLLFVIFQCLQISAIAQDADTTSIDWRTPEQSTFERLSNDSELNYPLSDGEQVGWFRRLYNFIVDAFQWVLSIFGKAGLSENMVYFIGSIALLIALWFLFRSRYQWIFGKGTKSGENIPYDIGNENIHEINYPDEIQKAVSEGNFRLAVRLEYLRTIKLLSDLQVIKYVEGKTNHEYVQEIYNSPYKNEFERLNYHFTYLWYGHFDADESQWKLVANEYDTIKKIVS